MNAQSEEEGIKEKDKYLPIATTWPVIDEFFAREIYRSAVSSRSTFNGFKSVNFEKNKKLRSGC